MLDKFYPEEFEEKLGEKGVRDLVNDLLDEMNFRFNKINKDENK